jgi:hypothetical protein
MLTQERLKEVLHYNKYVGVFTWRDKTNRRTYGKTAGAVKPGSGYIVIGIGKETYPAHHLVWLWHHGRLPHDQIDHIDGDRSNNLLSNLREVTQAQNSMNMKRNSSNTSGVKGVFFCKSSKRWWAVIKSHDKYVFRKSFKSLHDAEQSVRAAREALHGEFANHGIHRYEIEEMVDSE